MTATDQQQLGKTLWAIADDLRGVIVGTVIFVIK